MVRRINTRFKRYSPDLRRPSRIKKTTTPLYEEATLIQDSGGYKIFHQGVLVAEGLQFAFVEDIIDTMGVIGYYPIEDDCIQLILSKHGKCYLRAEYVVLKSDELDEHPTIERVLRRVENKVCVISPYLQINN